MPVVLTFKPCDSLFLKVSLIAKSNSKDSTVNTTSYLQMFKVLPILFRAGLSHLIIDPVLKVLTLPHVGVQSLCSLQIACALSSQPLQLVQVVLEAVLWMTRFYTISLLYWTFGDVCIQSYRLFILSWWTFSVRQLWRDNLTSLNDIHKLCKLSTCNSRLHHAVYIHWYPLVWQIRQLYLLALEEGRLCFTVNQYPMKSLVHHLEIFTQHKVEWSVWPWILWLWVV